MAKKKMTLEEKLEEAVVKDAPYEVPGNWVWTTIKSICGINMGQSPKGETVNDIGDGYPLIGGPSDMGELYPLKKRYATNVNKISSSGTIIMSIRATLGKINISDGEYCLGRGVTEIVPKGFIREYLQYYINYITKDLYKVAKGTTFLQISKPDLEGIEVPLSPLKEQQRIVDKIESLFEKLDKAKELIEEAREDFEKRKKIILKDAFVGNLTRNYRSRNDIKSNADELIKDIRNELEEWYKDECINAKLVGNKKPRKLNFDIQKSEFEYLFKEVPLTWRVSYFQEIIEPVDNALKAGPFGSSLKKSMYVEKGYKIYGQEQVISGNINYGDYYINEEKFNELKSCEVREGDLLISLVGTIGKTLIIPKEYEKGIINPRLLKISINKKISAEYIKRYFESPIAKYIMSEKSHGGTMEILNLDIIKKLPIPIPPIEEQIEIVRILDKLLEEESKIEELTQLEEQIELIKKSILAKAFRGQLGTNCEEDESALELLKEILMEK